jgi:hypothetical protein
MSNAKIYRKYAKDACKYVLHDLRLQGANWDQYRRQPSFEYCALRSDDLTHCEGLKNTLDKALYSDRIKSGTVDQYAEYAKKKRVGNCEEFSALVFCVLRDAGVKPIHRVALNRGDHIFVTLGKFDKNSSFLFDSNPLQWSPDSIVCDPWAEGMMQDKKYGVYSSTVINRYLKEILSLSSPPGFKVVDSFV